MKCRRLAIALLLWNVRRGFRTGKRGVIGRYDAEDSSYEVIDEDFVDLYYSNQLELCQRS